MSFMYDYKKYNEQKYEDNYRSINRSPYKCLAIM